MLKNKATKPHDKEDVKEGAEEQATLTMVLKDMVDRITGWMEDTAEMQTESNARTRRQDPGRTR